MRNFQKKQKKFQIEFFVRVCQRFFFDELQLLHIACRFDKSNLEPPAARDVL
jgi:hypothetical protein